MRIFALLAVLLIATTTTAQQHETFEYSWINDSTRQFKSDTHQIIFGMYKRSANGFKERQVSVNEDVYLFAQNETKAGLVQKVVDKGGTVVATVFLGPVNTNDIVSGELNLIWKRLGSNDWSYSLNGGEVMRFTYEKTDTGQRVRLAFDQSLPFAVQLAGLERAFEYIRLHDYSGREGRVQFGIKGGMNASILSASINSESNFKSGLNFGVYLKIPISKNTFFRPEIFYSSQGQKDNYTYSTGVDAGKTTTTLEYLNIPLLIETGKTITIQGGLQVGVLLAAREVGEITGDAVDDDLKELMNKVDLAMVLGLGANITPRFNFGVRYNLGVTEIFASDYEPYPGLEFPSVSNRVFHFFIGYSF